MGLGYVEGVTNDYIRHGPTTQFAAPSPAPGVPELPAKDRKEVPKELNLHLIVDNYCSHKYAWLAQRFHIHYPPTFASWLMGGGCCGAPRLNNSI